MLLMTLLCRRAVGNDEIRIGLLSIPSAGALHFIEEPYFSLLLRCCYVPGDPAGA